MRDYEILVIARDNRDIIVAAHLSTKELRWDGLHLTTDAPVLIVLCDAAGESTAAVDTCAKTHTRI